LSIKRTGEFERNQTLERLLGELNADLSAAESQQASKFISARMDFPIVLIMGPLRSGTTLFMQWLANTGLVAYPTNLLSRFYMAPIIGAKIQLLLTDPRFNFREELGEFSQQSEYKSENGKTKGVLAPNEFWYFWRRFLSDSDRDVWTNEELANSFDVQTMRSELMGLMDVLQKPFAAKGMLFNYNIPFLDSVLDKVVFVQLQRDLATNVASALEARKRQLGGEDEWYSFEIPEYQELKHLAPAAQVEGQVSSIDAAVTRGLESVDDARKISVQYEAFCEHPDLVFDELTKKLGMVDVHYSGPASFEVSRK